MDNLPTFSPSVLKLTTLFDSMFVPGFIIRQFGESSQQGLFQQPADTVQQEIFLSL
jgi:hypothetical protein